MTTYKLKNKPKRECPIREHDENGNLIHYKNYVGLEYLECWFDYDNKGNLIHQKDSNGYEYWYDYDNKGNEIHYKNSEGYGYWKGEKGNKITEEEFNKIWEKVE